MWRGDLISADPQLATVLEHLFSKVKTNAYIVIPAKAGIQLL
jgi:hypothetical protein